MLKLEDFVDAACFLWHNGDVATTPFKRLRRAGYVDGYVLCETIGFSIV